MKQTLLSFIIAAHMLVAAVTARADFDDTGAGARAIGLGGAFTAIADDVFGIYYNPAGLGTLRTAQAGADLGKLYTGLDDESNLLSGFTAIALPILKSRPARITLSTGTAGSPVITTVTVTGSYLKHYGTVAVGWKYFTLADYYQESAYYLSYGRPLSARLSVGGSVKLLSETYVIDDYLRLSPVFDYGNKNSVQNISADLGVLFNVSPRLFVGASVLDVNQPDLGLLAEDKLPATGNIGIGWKEKNLAWGLTAMARREQWYYSTGFERYLTRLFGVRGGVSVGGSQYFNIAAGFSINLYRVQLDYVFQYPISGIEDISGTHRMSFLLRFGRRAKEEAEAGSLEYYYAALQEELEHTRQRLLAAEADKHNLETMLLADAAGHIRERLKTAQAGGAPDVAPAAAQAITFDDILPAPRRSTALKYTGDSKLWTGIYPVRPDSIGLGGALIAAPTSSSRTSAAPAGVKVISLPGVGLLSVPATETTPALDTAVNQGAGNPELSASAALPAAGQTMEKQASSAPKKAGPRRHIVAANENLRTIADKYYNDGDRWKVIYRANKDKVVNGQVSPGRELIIPE